jgi:hypothetical protein
LQRPESAPPTRAACILLSPERTLPCRFVPVLSATSAFRASRPRCTQPGFALTASGPRTSSASVLAVSQRPISKRSVEFLPMMVPSKLARFAARQPRTISIRFTSRCICRGSLSGSMRSGLVQHALPSFGLSCSRVENPWRTEPDRQEAPHPHPRPGSQSRSIDASKSR